ncbi:esterase B1-like [Sabethes cyaneus]|uniref:esterase B1-like n=1 Tax=Sabethes cyaneus TaxID=53552 RepID=UPI00237DDCB4|nr:esterase B1-like [Sabethes cyaneus]
MAKSTATTPIDRREDVSRFEAMFSRQHQPTASNAESRVKIEKESNRILVCLPQGMLNGVRDKLPNNGADYFYFRGIPYAKPPVGDLRFASPVPLKKFPAVVLDCSKEGSSFVGTHVLSRNITGCEDGLFLNVYTPAIPKNQQHHSFPVMVFIHGGASIGGDSSSLLYHPNYLVQEGVVVVTMNYRLGVLGLLCLPEAGIEGNGSLKDQRAVLRWVSENIAKFGGNPGNVTLFGASSGGGSVGLHCVSESSRKYFHKAIMQSGHQLCDFPYSEQVVQKSRKLAKIFGYEGNCDKEALMVLKKVPPRSLVQKQFEVLTAREKELEKIYHIPFGHVIERKDSEDALLTMDPREFIRINGSYGMPIIMGFNNGEASMELKCVMAHLNDFNSQWERYIPRSLKVDYFEPIARTIGEEINKFYLGTQPASESTTSEILQLISERYTYTAYIFAYLWSQFQRDSNLYCYRFAFDGALNHGKVLTDLPPIKAAAHMDEIFYLFSSLLVPEVAETNKAFQVRRTMVRLWTNFAKCSNPTPADDSEIRFRWNPVAAFEPGSAESFDPQFLNVEQSFRMGSVPEKRGFEFWARLHEKYNGRFDCLEFPVENLNKESST